MTIEDRRIRTIMPVLSHNYKQSNSLIAWSFVTKFVIVCEYYISISWDWKGLMSMPVSVTL